MLTRAPLNAVHSSSSVHYGIIAVPSVRNPANQSIASTSGQRRKWTTEVHLYVSICPGRQRQLPLTRRTHIFTVSVRVLSSTVKSCARARPTYCDGTAAGTFTASGYV